MTINIPQRPHPAAANSKQDPNLESSEKEKPQEEEEEVENLFFPKADSFPSPMDLFTGTGKKPVVTSPPVDNLPEDFQITPEELLEQMIQSGEITPPPKPINKPLSEKGEFNIRDLYDLIHLLQIQIDASSSRDVASKSKQSKEYEEISTTASNWAKTKAALMFGAGIVTGLGFALTENKEAIVKVFAFLARNADRAVEFGIQAPDKLYDMKSTLSRDRIQELQAKLSRYGEWQKMFQDALQAVKAAHNSAKTIRS